MGAILRVPRSRQHALTTALRVDMAYLCVGVQTVFSLLLAPLFSAIFQGEVYGDGFGYRMGVIMTVFTCAMWVLTMAVADLQNGFGFVALFRLQGRTRWPRDMWLDW